MKQQVLFVFIMLCALTGSAQNINASSVPVIVKAGFSKAHPKTVGKWEREGAAYEVNFKEGGKTISCVVDKSGTIQATETDIKVAELPASVKTYVAAHYKTAAIKEAAHIVKADGTTVYEANVAGEDLLFREDGTFIKADKE